MIMLANSDDDDGDVDDDEVHCVIDRSQQATQVTHVMIMIK